MKNFFRSINSLGLVEGVKVYTLLKNKKINHIKLNHAAAPISLRGGTSDIPAFKKVFIKKEYDVHITPDPEVIIDANAKLGLPAIFFALKYNQARIFSIEPDKGMYKLLTGNAFFYKNITCLNTALWDKASLVELKNNGNESADTIEEVSAKTKDSFLSISIHDVIKKYELKQIDILKLDIQAAEKIISSSAYQYWLTRTKIIMIEPREDAKQDRSKFYDTLSQHNFDLYPKGKNIIAVNKNMAQKTN
jgi:FkbM family methyltransferase